MKIFLIGLSRTGTTSLSKMLEDKGYKVFSQSMKYVTWKGISKDKLRQLVYNYDVLVDYPIPFVYKFLYYQFTNSRFILTYRKDFDTWFNSMVKHTNRAGYSLVKHKYLKIENPYNLDKDKLRRIYNGHNNSVALFFNDKKNFLKLCLETDNISKLNKFLKTDFKSFYHINKSDNWTLKGKIKSQLCKIKYYTTK